MTYEPTLESVRTHVVPDWFHDAKLGIFIHWGLYSVPGWAPTTGPLYEVVAREGWQGWFARNPYAEWYMNSLRIPGSPTASYHAQHFGADFPYERFVETFNRDTSSWDPSRWADLFRRAGAQYVVLTTKHHDGFLLWPSARPNPFRDGYHATRDLVGDLTGAVRDAGLRMGLYYSGGLDWTFNDRVIADMIDLFMGVPQQAAYVEYANAHWKELIDRYQPSVLWNDIGYPAAANLPELFSYYYNTVPEGVINDRFTQAPVGDGPPDPAAIMQAVAQGMLPAPPHFDFRTPEYAVFPDIKAEKWESCRGLGYSFGYNRNETVDDMLSPAELVRSFVDIVSKNGNLLINVGPMGDGTIPTEQAERLEALGAWLAVNGEAIYGSRPWTRAEGTTDSGIGVRFTRKGADLYAILLDTPQQPQVTLTGLTIPAGASVTLFGYGDIAAVQRDSGLTVTLPSPLADAPAHTIKIVGGAA